MSLHSSVPSADQTEALVNEVSVCVNENTPMNIVGNSSKAFLGSSRNHKTVAVAGHCGVISYEPTELVLTARSGTPIAELEKLLADNGQMMPFEPPVFAGNDTLGGVMAAGLSGPRRTDKGSARDYVLGMNLINGKAEHLSFGGEVMKNVAGYDVSRLQVGAMGTLGLILQVSMKVLPVPETEQTVLLENNTTLDVSRLVQIARQPLPVSASAVRGRQCWLRLSGSAASVSAAQRIIGGDLQPDAGAFWQSLRNHTHEFFDTTDALWRISIPAHSAKLALEGEWLYEWGGAQRWLRTSSATAEQVFATCAAHGAHATRYRGLAPGAPSFQPLTGVLATLNQQIKEAFDPQGLFNPGRFHNA